MPESELNMSLEKQTQSAGNGCVLTCVCSKSFTREKQRTESDMFHSILIPSEDIL